MTSVLTAQAGRRAGMARALRLTQHGEHLYKLTHFGLVNCYLLLETDGLSVIDTGLSGTAAGLLVAADTLGQPIKRILLTHYHADHVGGLDKLHTARPEAEVMMGRRDSKLLVDDVTLEPGEPDVPVKPQNLGVATRPTRLLEDGEQVGSLRVVASPGHSPGHLAFLDARDGTLIAGDALVTVLGMAVAGVKGPQRWRFPLPHWFTWHAPTALASAEKLTRLKPVRLAVGHGGVVEQPAKVMQRAVDELSQQLGG